MFYRLILKYLFQEIENLTVTNFTLNIFIHIVFVGNFQIRKFNYRQFLLG